MADSGFVLNEVENYAQLKPLDVMRQYKMQCINANETSSSEGKRKRNANANETSSSEGKIENFTGVEDLKEWIRF